MTQETIQEVSHQYFHPSQEDAAAREQMMQEINRHMSARMEGNTEIVSYDDLDLSFLSSCSNNACGIKESPSEIFSNSVDIEMDLVFNYNCSQIGNFSLDAA